MGLSVGNTDVPAVGAGMGFGVVGSIPPKGVGGAVTLPPVDVDVGETDNVGALVGTNHPSTGEFDGTFGVGGEEEVDAVGDFVGIFGVLLNVGAFVLELGCAFGPLVGGPLEIVGATVPSPPDCSVVGPLDGLGVNFSTACWATLHK